MLSLSVVFFLQGEKGAQNIVFIALGRSDLGHYSAPVNQIGPVRKTEDLFDFTRNQQNTGAVRGQFRDRAVNFFARTDIDPA